MPYRMSRGIHQKRHLTAAGRTPSPTSPFVLGRVFEFLYRYIGTTLLLSSRIVRVPRSSVVLVAVRESESHAEGGKN